MAKTEEVKGFVSYVKDYIEDKIYELVGCEVYLCDLSLELTDGIRADGSFTYSTYKARKLMEEWWYECGAFYDYMLLNCGDYDINIFFNTEQFLVDMLTDGINCLLYKCECMTDGTYDIDGCVEFTDEMADKIVSQLGDISNEEDIF